MMNSHHQSVFAWYIADEPDGAHWDPNITSQVYQTVKHADTKGRPVALCLDTTPSVPGSWQQFVPYTDIIMPDIYPISGRPPPPPAPPPGQCGKCPAARPVLYGSESQGYYCKVVAAPGGRECCLLPGSTEACQGVARCGTNPSNYTPCVSVKVTGAASIGPALDRVRAFTDKPILFIAQAFGGGESYPRAPTAVEERLMTYIAWIHGSQGVMYFADDWSAGKGGMRDMPANDRTECERLGLEGAELTSALSSGMNSTKAGAPTLTVSDDRIEAGAFVETGRLEAGGGVVILIANTANTPVRFTVTASGGSVEDGPAAVMFTGTPNRLVAVKSGVFSDSVDAMSTRAYRLNKTKVADLLLVPKMLHVTPNPKNLLLNPSFEHCANVEFPDGYSVNIGRDPEAAVFVDSRDSIHGLHSLRVHTPSDGGGLQVLAYPPEAAYAKLNTTFQLSLWARGVGVNPLPPTLRFGAPYYDFLPWGDPMPCTVGPPPHTGPSAACSEFSRSVTLTSEWTRYTVDVKTPGHVLNGDTSWVFFQLEGKGKALVDLLELVEA